MFRLLAIIGIIATIIVLIAPAGAKVYTVDDDWAGADFSSVWGAVDYVNTQEENNVTLRVHAGWYNETSVVEWPMSIIGNGSDETIVRGYDNDATFDVDADEVRIEHMNVSRMDDDEVALQLRGQGINVTNCSISGKDDEIVNCWGVDYLTMDNCTFDHGEEGIRLWRSKEVAIKECSFVNISRAGIRLFEVRRSHFLNSTFDGNGFMIHGTEPSHHRSHVIDNCTIDGDPIVYHARKHGITVLGSAGQLILGDCTDVTVDGFSSDAGSIGIMVSGCTNTSIVDSSITASYTDVYISDSTWCNVSESQMTSASIGVTIRDSHNCTVQNITLNGTIWGTGVYILEHCWNNVIADSTFASVYSGVDTNGNGTLVRNCSVAWGRYGVRIEETRGALVTGCNISRVDRGIRIDESRLNRIENCSVHHCSEYGIGVDDSDNTTIVYNEFFMNDGPSVYINYPLGMHFIHHNNFHNGSGSGNMTHDETSYSVWDDGVSEGNHFSDWNGSGPYTIGGPGGREDRYPLGSPVDNDAPEKVPEFGVLISVCLVAFAVLLIRRRRVR